MLSLTIKGLIVSIIGLILGKAGINGVSEQIEVFLEVTLQIIGAVMIYWGRYRAGGITIFGTKK